MDPCVSFAFPVALISIGPQLRTPAICRSVVGHDRGTAIGPRHRSRHDRPCTHRRSAMPKSRRRGRAIVRRGFHADSSAVGGMIAGVVEAVRSEFEGD